MILCDRFPGRRSKDVLALGWYVTPILGKRHFSATLIEAEPFWRNKTSSYEYTISSP
jgi:hypothetical protein